MEHYFTNNPDLKSEIREIRFSYKEYNFVFLSDNGVFAKDKIDYASKLLLDNFLNNTENKNHLQVLDVGSGYGFLGVTISKILDCNADMIDVNKRAVHLCERNIHLNKINGRAFYSDCYENITEKYDYIVTNPPIRAGKDIYMKILRDAKEHLKNSGELWFVISKDQGAKSTKKALEEWYNVECIAKSKGFNVFRAKVY